jgi:hypothetical protein
MARKRTPPISANDRAVIGTLLRDLRRAAGYRSVEEAVGAGSPASRQTTYSYERGVLTPSLSQFLQIVEFYVLAGPTDRGKPAEDLRAQGVAAVARALTLDAYNVARAWELIGRMQPGAADGRGRGRR